MGLKLLSLNAKGLNSPHKRKALWTDALKFGSDIVCVQESHFAKNNSPKFTHNRYPHIFHSDNHKKKQGVIIAVRDTVTFKMLDLQTDDHGRFIILVATIDNITYTIANVYASNTHPHQFLQKIF